MNTEKAIYVSCIRVDGKPILPPLVSFSVHFMILKLMTDLPCQMNDDRRRAMRQLRDEAVAVELRAKQRRRAQLLEQVQVILDKCVTLDELNVSKVEPSKYRLISEPLLRTPVRVNTSLSEPAKETLPITSYSLPSTPIIDEISIQNLHKKFLSMKQETKDTSISECSSAVSTDLGPYMHNSDSDLSSTDSSTPRAMSDTDVSTSLDCSTPIKSQRVRRLSYTLDAPSPVLLKVMQNKAAIEQEKTAVKVVPKLNLSDSDESSKSELSYPKAVADRREDVQSETSIETCTMTSVKPSNTNNEDSPNRQNQVNFNHKPFAADDVTNGNSTDKHKQASPPHRSLNESNKPNSNEPSRDTNGNTHRKEVPRGANLIEEFLMQQEKMMNELLEKQAKEQERLVNMFKEQEEQLVMQLQVQTTQQPTIARSKSPARRSLQQSFDRSAKARCLFESGHLSALVRGYLTRRLLATDRVQSIIQTIRDTTTCLKELNQGSMTILPSDVELHRRLLQQLNGAIHALHEIFFEWDVNERMLVIARDREKKAGLLIVSGMPIRMRPRSRSLSSATVKSLERKLSRQDSSRNSSRPSSASTAQPRTSPSSMASSSVDRKRSPSSASSFSSYSAAQSNGKVDYWAPFLRFLFDLQSSYSIT